MTDIRNADRRTGETVFFWLLFAVSAAVRIALSVFPKIAANYPEEMLNLELAQNIMLRGQLTVCRLPAGVTGILYPALLAPFYAIRDGQVRLTAMSVFNAVLISSALIPGKLLSGRILKERKHRIAALVLFALTPELWLSATFMSECLFLPMAVWTCWIAYRAFEKGAPDTGPSAALGLWACLLCLAGKAGAFLGAGIFALYVFRALAGREGRKKAAAGGACFIAVFAAAGLAVSLTAFGGVKNALKALYLPAMPDSPQALLYTLAAAGILLLHYLTGTMFFPAAVPLSRARRLDAGQKRLLVPTCVYAAGTLLATACAVSAADGIGRMDLRVILHDLMPVTWVFLTLYLAADESRPEGKKEPLYRDPLLRAALVFAALCLLFLRFPRMASPSDAPTLQFALKLRGRDWLVTAAKIGIPVLLLCGALLRRAGKGRLLRTAVTAALAAACAVNGCLFLKEAAKAGAPLSKDVQAQATELDRYLETLGGKTLIIRREADNPVNRMIDTYCTEDCYSIDIEDLRTLAIRAPEPGILRLEDTTWPAEPWMGGNRKGAADRIDHIVCADTSLEFNGDSAQEITPDSLSFVQVYRNADPAVLDVTDLFTLREGEPIFFMERFPDYEKFPHSGFYYSEPDFTWTKDAEASITIKVPKGETPLQLTWCVAMTIGEQRCQVFANDRVVFDGLVNGRRELGIALPEDLTREGGMVTLRFVLPDARQPGNGDPRVLGIAFESLALEERFDGEEED